MNYCFQNDMQNYLFFCVSHTGQSSQRAIPVHKVQFQHSFTPTFLFLVRLSQILVDFFRVTGVTAVRDCLILLLSFPVFAQAGAVIV